MALHTHDKKILATLRGLFVAQTNAGIWVRLLGIVVIGNVVGITLSLLFFLSVRGVGSQIIESSVQVPRAREINGEHVREVLNAFAVRAATFEARLQGGISIPDPY